MSKSPIETKENKYKYVGNSKLLEDFSVAVESIAYPTYRVRILGGFQFAQDPREINIKEMKEEILSRMIPREVVKLKIN